MNEQKIVIAALARDCSEALQKNIPRLEKLATCFREARFVVVENDSRDGTKEILGEWAQRNSSVTVISQDFGSTTIANMSYADPYPYFGHSRISKMAKYRNIYMDYISENIHDVDLLLMIDIDVESFEAEEILNSIQDAPDNWGALFGFGKSAVSLLGCGVFDLYWDTYAYVHKDVKEPITLRHINVMHRRVAKMVNQEGYHKCASAFGGLGIYKWECVKDKRYIVEENDDKDVKVKCEHIPFNEAISAEYGLYISRSMVVDYGNKNFVGYCLRKIVPSKIKVFISKLKSGRK